MSETAEPKKLVDPINGCVYTAREDGLVDVVDPSTGQSGVFDEFGQWHSGDLTYANRQLLGWIGRLAIRRAGQGGAS